MSQQGHYIAGLLAAGVVLVAAGVSLMTSRQSTQTLGVTADADTITTMRLVGGIAPHHILVGEQSVRFLRELEEAEATPAGVILLVPNHHETGGPQLVIPERDSYFWREVTERDDWRPDDEIIAAEESVETWEIFRRQANLDWPMHPALVSMASSREQIDNLAETIARLLDEGYLVIASVDFSHYRALAEAEVFDARTQTLVTTGELEKIWSLDNDHVDSAKILYLVTKLAHDGVITLDWVWHGNSAEKTPTVDDANTTSYFVVKFYAE